MHMLNGVVSYMAQYNLIAKPRSDGHWIIITKDLHTLYISIPKSSLQPCAMQ